MLMKLWRKLHKPQPVPNTRIKHDDRGVPLTKLEQVQDAHNQQAKAAEGYSATAKPVDPAGDKLSATGGKDG